MQLPQRQSTECAPQAISRNTPIAASNDQQAGGPGDSSIHRYRPPRTSTTGIESVASCLPSAYSSRATRSGDGTSR